MAGKGTHSASTPPTICGCSGAVLIAQHHSFSLNVGRMYRVCECRNRSGGALTKATTIVSCCRGCSDEMLGCSTFANDQCVHSLSPFAFSIWQEIGKERNAVPWLNAICLSFLPFQELCFFPSFGPFWTLTISTKTFGERGALTLENNHFGIDLVGLTPFIVGSNFG